MPFVPHTEADVREMLKEIGVEKIEELFKSIPEEIRIKDLDDLPEAATEQEVHAGLQMMSEENLPLTGETSFIGGGPMRMYIPAVVGEITRRSEFITSYTPYQAEISQGLLQSIYEYQSMVSSLLGMAAANASSYDVGSAAADALVVARDNFRGKRHKVLVAESLHPEIREVMQTYNGGLGLEWIDIPVDGQGRIDHGAVESKLDKEVCAVFVQYPTRHGVVEDLTSEGLPKLIEKIHEAGALAIAVVNVIGCALLKPPGELGFDIAVAEGQPLGLPMGYGGPYLGIFTVQEKLLRKIPGRISGKTVDVEGRPGYVLTLQAREQHIRRERATSNICTAQAHCAVAAVVYLAYYGKEGFVELARKIMGMTQYAKRQIAGRTKFELVHEGVPHFHEFVLKCPVPASEVNENLLEEGIIGGLTLDRWGEDANHMLIGIGDTNTVEEIDALVEVLALI